MQKVAKLSATVLILGESGTGKELLARLLHRESGSGDAPFIAVNLSAIPHELVESTLFGHERGAFTGAHKQQLGKFELAAGGTLFLDEIGDLRFDLQAKLLRAIQEGEIERVGGTKPIRTDFRLIVATNVDLEQGGQGRHGSARTSTTGSTSSRSGCRRCATASRTCRSWRGCFSTATSTKFRKPVRGIADSALKILRLVLVAGQHPRAREPDRAARRGERQGMDHRRGPAARVPLRQARLGAGDQGETLFQEACDTFERNFILRALEKSDWNVTATARYLGIPLSTLKHKMARLDLRDHRAEAARLRYTESRIQTELHGHGVEHGLHGS